MELFGTTVEVIKAFLAGRAFPQAVKNSTVGEFSVYQTGTEFYSYRTLVAKRNGKTLYVTLTKYSRTTGKQLSLLKNIANKEGYTIETFTREMGEGYIRPRFN